MENKEVQSLWEQFITENFASRPRFRSLLERTQIVDCEAGYEARIPVSNQAQENWLSERGLSPVLKLLEHPKVIYNSLSTLQFAFLREDGSVIKAKPVIVASEERRIIDDFYYPTHLKFPSRLNESDGPNTENSTIKYYDQKELLYNKSRHNLCLSERIEDFAKSIYSFESGGKRYTSPLLGIIALPVFIVAWIVSIFEKR